jgi:hypothetical protein
MYFLLQISASLRLIISMCFAWNKRVLCCDKEENITYQGITDLMTLICEFQYFGS